MNTAAPTYWLSTDDSPHATGPHTVEELQAMRPAMKGKHPRVMLNEEGQPWQRLADVLGLAQPSEDNDLGVVLGVVIIGLVIIVGGYSAVTQWQERDTGIARSAMEAQQLKTAEDIRARNDALKREEEMERLTGDSGPRYRRELAEEIAKAMKREK